MSRKLLLTLILGLAFFTFSEPVRAGEAGTQLQQSLNDGITFLREVSTADLEQARQNLLKNIDASAIRVRQIEASRSLQRENLEALDSSRFHQELAAIGSVASLGAGSAGIGAAAEMTFGVPLTVGLLGASVPAFADVSGGVLGNAVALYVFPGTVGAGATSWVEYLVATAADTYSTTVPGGLPRGTNPGQAYALALGKIAAIQAEHSALLNQPVAGQAKWSDNLLRTVTFGWSDYSKINALYHFTEKRIALYNEELNLREFADDFSRHIVKTIDMVLAGRVSH